MRKSESKEEYENSVEEVEAVEEYNEEEECVVEDDKE